MKNLSAWQRVENALNVYFHFLLTDYCPAIFTKGVSGNHGRKARHFNNALKMANKIGCKMDLEQLKVICVQQHLQQAKGPTCLPCPTL